MKNNLFFLKISILLFHCLLAVDNYAQDDIEDNAEPFAKHFNENSNLGDDEMRIEIRPAQYSGIFDVQWNYCAIQNITASTSTDCSRMFAPNNSSVDLGQGLNAIFYDAATSPTSRPMLQITSTNPLEGELYLDLELTFEHAGGSQSIEKEYYLNFRNPIELVFVLDRSGSMECDPLSTDSWDDCIAANPTLSRWYQLKDAAQSFVDKFVDTLAADSINVVYFSGGISNSTSLDGFHPVRDYQETGIDSDMFEQENLISGGRLSRDGTSIGAGLLESISNRLSSGGDTRQIVIVFSDGEANRSPDIDLVDNRITRMEGDGGGGPRTVTLLDLNDIGNIEIFSVAIAEQSPAYRVLLEGITTDPMNNFFAVDMGGMLIDEMTTNLYAKIFERSSPNVIRFEDQEVKPTNTAEFSCNKDVNLLYFEAHFDRPIAKNKQYKVMLGKKEVTQYAKKRVGNYYATYTFDFQKIKDIKSKGRWKFIATTIDSGNINRRTNNRLNTTRIQNRAIIITQNEINQSKIRLSATADDQVTTFKATVGNKKIKAGEGESMPLLVDFLCEGIPLENAKVRATILKPGDDLGDILAKQAIPLKEPPNLEEGSCASQKLNYLKKENPEVLNKLKEIEKKEIDLQHKGKGRFVGEYNDLDVSGIYKVIFTVRARTPSLGVIERTEEKTINVHVGKIEVNSSENLALEDANGKIIGLNVKPFFKDGNGNTRFISPGMSYALGLKGNGIEQLQIADNCDGSYHFSFAPLDASQVQLQLLDEIIYTGNVATFPKNGVTGPNPSKKPPKKNYFSILPRYIRTIPLQQLNELYNAGNSVEASFVFPLSRRAVNLELTAGLYNFDTDFNIYGGTGYLTYDLTNKLEKFALNIGIGGGLYKPKNLDSTPGYSGKATLSRRLNSNMIVTFDWSYFKLIDPDYSFATAGVGLKFNL